MFEDPSDPTYIYAEAQGGDIGRVNRYTHEARAIKPYAAIWRKETALQLEHAHPDQPQRKGHDLYRRAVPLPLARSRPVLGAHLARPHHQRPRKAEAGRIRRRHRRQLRRRDEHHHLLHLASRPRTAQLIWVGTDDGNVQITRDGGKTWTNVIANVQGVGKSPWVSWVEASRFAEGTAYATFDRHMYGDMKPYVFKTTDYGTDLDASRHRSERRARLCPRHQGRHRQSQPALPRHRVRPVDQHRWRHSTGRSTRAASFPAVAVRDLVVHPRTSDLVLATHGRGIWIIDDISPLRALTPDMMAKEAAFLPVRRRRAMHSSLSAAGRKATTPSAAPAVPTDAVIPYYQRRATSTAISRSRSSTPKGKLVDTIASSKHRGVNRATWSMRLKPPKVPPAASALFGAAQSARAFCPAPTPSR